MASIEGVQWRQWRWPGLFGAGWGWGLLGYLVGIGGALLVSLAMGLLGPNVRTSEMLYLVPVVFVATRWGIKPAAVSAIVAFLTYDFLYVLQVGLLPAARPEEWLTLLVLLFTAIVTGQLGAWARRASARAREAELLRSSDELKSALLHAVSHDLRTPLASIKASVTGLLQPGARLDEADRRELLSAINEETDRLTHLVSNLLDLSRIEAGSLRAERDWHDLGEIIGGVVDRLGPLVGEREIRVRLPEDLPLVPLDYVLAERVLANLLENALRHGGPKGPIDIMARTIPGAVRVEVGDRGPGVPVSERERIFDRFYQGRRRTGGVGLGLAIARGMVEAHGGRLWVEPRSGGGALFVFILPLDPAGPKSQVSSPTWADDGAGIRDQEAQTSGLEPGSGARRPETET